MALQRSAHHHTAGPTAARIAAAAAVVLLAMGATGCGGDEGTTSAPAVEAAATVDFDQLADDAIAAADVELSTAAMRTLIDRTCGATTGTVGALGADLLDIAGETGVRQLTQALGDAAALRCPDEATESPELINTIFSAALEQTTTTTTAAPTTTTIAPTTTTAAAPTTTTTAAPPPPPPTTAATQPPPPPAPSTYYANCSAARAAGAAPVYRGQPGYGSHLDRDDDGVGCES
jgi:hypothetical protein